MRNRCELTERETEVFRLLAAGYKRRVVADRLLIDEGTIATHVNHILGKLAADNLTHAVNIALRQGILTIDRKSVV